MNPAGESPATSLMQRRGKPIRHAFWFCLAYMSLVRGLGDIGTHQRPHEP